MKFLIVNPFPLPIRIPLGPKYSSQDPNTRMVGILHRHECFMSCWKSSLSRICKLNTIRCINNRFLRGSQSYRSSIPRIHNFNRTVILTDSKIAVQAGAPNITPIVLYCILLYCIVIKGWSLLHNALRPFQDLLCSPEFRYY